jgi:hypothetical protein
MRIDFSRGAFRTWAVAVLASGFLGTAAALAAIYPDRYLEGDSPGTRVMAWVCAVLFLAPFVLLLAAAPGMLVRHGLTIDATGIAPIAWHELTAVGIAHQLVPLSHPNKAITHRSQFVLDLFPKPGVSLDGRLDGLTTRSGPPPRQGLPRDHYGMALPTSDSVPARIEQAVTTYAPRLWLGSYPRQPESSDNPAGTAPPGEDGEHISGT